MNYLSILLLFLLSFSIFIIAVYFLKYKKLKNDYKNFKLQINNLFNFSYKNPSDDYVIHQIDNHLKNISEKYSLEKSKRANIYSILDKINEGILIISINPGDIIQVYYANEFSKQLFTTENFIGRSLSSIIDNHNLIDLVLKSFKRKIAVEDEIVFYLPEKKTFSCKIDLTNIDDLYRVVILSDITKEKSLEVLRREFLTIMSHELRTPLAVINGYLETILMKENLDKENEKMLSIIEDETARLTRLVNDLLDMGRLEKSSLSVEKFEKLNLSELINTAYDFFKLLSDEINISFINEIEEDIFIKGNEDRMFQAIYNLIDNAIKFTSVKEDSEEKTVWIRLYQEQDCDEKNEVIFEIEDTGMGIPSKELQKIFHMFYRVDKSRTRQMSGFGLGLYIVKTILDNHNATIYLESEENNGSLFRIIFKEGVKVESV